MFSAVDKFKAEHQRYEDAAQAVARRIKEIASAAQIPCTVSARAKDIQSFQKKILVKKYWNPWQEVTDKAGARAIVQSAKMVDNLLAHIRHDFGGDLLRVEDKREVIDPDRLGYSGVHVQVVAVPETATYERIECEIQLRTAAQDVWSVVSHQVLYKPILSLPSVLQHAAYRLVALVEMFDEEVQRIMDASKSLPGHEVIDLLEIAEREFLSLGQSSSNREMSVEILEAIQGSMDASERAGYGATLHAFVESQDAILKELFKDYGASGPGANVPSYLLFSQAESLILIERLTNKPYSLLEHWRAAGLPDVYIEGLADVAGINLPS